MLVLSGVLHSVWFQGLAGRYVGDVCSRWSGHEVSLRGLQFNLFKRAVSVQGLRVLDKQGREMVTAESVYLGLSSYVFTNFDMAVLSAYRPRIRIEKRSADSVSDFSALLTKLGSLKKHKERRNVTSIRQLRVLDGQFLYDDRSVSPRDDGRLDFKHVDVSAFSTHIQNLHIFNKHVCGRILSLSVEEKSGLAVRDLQTWVGFSPDRLALRHLNLTTAHSCLRADIRFDYDSPKAFARFADAVNMDITLYPGARLSTRDLGCFAPVLQPYRQTVTLSGHAQGRLRNITVRDLKLAFGQHSRLAADLHWRNFPALIGSQIELDLADLYVDMPELLAIPGLDLASSLPAALASLSYASARGRFSGSLEKFDTRMSLYTNLGNGELDIQSWDTLQRERYFVGSLVASDLEVGVLSGLPDWLGALDADLHVSAIGSHYDDMRYTLNGRLFNLSLNGHPVDTIILDCQTRKHYLHGAVTGTDTNLNFCFDGLLDYEREEPISRYMLDIDKVDLQAFGIVSDETPFTVSGEVSTDYVGRVLDDILGNLRLQNLQVERHGERFYLPNLSLETRSTDSLHKTTNLTSDLLDLQLSGIYTLSRFPALYKDLLRVYMPGNHVLAPASGALSATPQVFDLSLGLHAYRYDHQDYGVNRLLDVMWPSLRMDEQTRLTVHCDEPARVFSLDLESRYIGFQSILCTDGKFVIQTVAEPRNSLVVSAETSAIYLSDSISLQNFGLKVVIDENGLATCGLGWVNPGDSVAPPSSLGYLSAIVDFSDTNALSVRLDTSYFVFSGRVWRSYPDAFFVWKNQEADFHNIGIYGLSDQASICMSGRWASDTASELDLVFRSFNLRYIAPIVRRIGMEVAGEIDGRMRVRDPGNSFDLSADVRLNDLRLNDGYYGKGLLTAVFNRENRQIDGRLTIGPDTVARPYLALDGYVDLKRKTLDFKGRLHHLPSQFLSGYFRSFATDLTGGLDGSLRLYGPLKRMKWDLQAESEDLALTLSLLNTRYQFIRMGLSMSEEAITFTDGRLRDVRYDTRGRLSGSVHHRYLKDIELDLKLDFDQFLVLNTVPVKDMIYSGRVFATGRVVLSGLTNNLYIGVTARTDEDSHIDFDFSSTGGASASNFIRFEAERPVEINPLKAFYARRQQKEKGKGRLTVDLGLAINPQLAVGLAIHNVTVNGTLNAVGTGNMRLLVEPRGTQLFGTYSILSGVFDFSMMDLLNKRFKLKEGGNIVWTGPMTDARVNMEAVYATRTSLYPILAASGATTMIDAGNLRKKVGVESIIRLDGNLLNPDIRFDINLTNVEDDVKDLFFSYVNKENEDEMIRQTFSLLMFNNFMATGGDGQGGGMLSGSNALASSSELLFSQFNSFLSRLTTNFNVGMNYTPGSEMKESEFQVMLSGQLFDDRLTIDGNIGVSEIEAKNASSIVGDINVEWKFTEQLRLKAFNRSNEKSLAQPDNSYTQGLGVIFRRDFNTGKELFSRIGPTKEERKKQRAARKARHQAEKAEREQREH